MENLSVDANPTKDFFISMLTRDIPLDRAILDLIDNSVDAANTLNKDDLNGKEIKITLDESGFKIEDNCGGFDVETARLYAFRFGRDSKSERLTPNSVGQFGVGMKRTLFKLGNNFTVRSVFPNGAFELTVDVQDWLSSESEKWEFQLQSIEKPNDANGTYIEVSNLFDSVKEQFVDNEFLRCFKEEVAIAYFKRINQGLKIYINGDEVDLFDIKVRQSDELSIISLEDTFNNVSIKVKVGVGEQDLHKGGWYIVCNGRLVESSEQSTKTLWGTNSIPKYHDRFAFFRGVVEFESEDSSKLPWTTTKTGVDLDNRVYRYANKLMISAIEPIIKFLNQREAERKQAAENRLEEEETVLALAIRNAESISIYQADCEQEQFIRPDKIEARAAKYGSISYQVEIDKLTKVKEVTGAKSASEAGKITFDNYFDYEC
ncbi:ATP-binding protein [Algibacillus agarilyticus]|uniref:ATP-binding protein n=1 Tax=Algibacillus agarilyticus TaxID=2234133 RepID=UPI001300A41B|nr:ATP-binding protein [Algibacillus agarilyticus]